MRKLLIGLVGAICLTMMSGCASYLHDRKFGDYYCTTKSLWGEPFSHSGSMFPETKSIGQTFGLSGLLFFYVGHFVTMPVGIAIHYVEPVTIAPVYDTLCLPFDLYNRSEYLQKTESKTRGQEGE